MIRRNPTMIALCDTDVQDVKEMMAKKRAATEAETISSLGATNTTDALLAQAAKERAKKDAMTNEQRLGLR
ncbi:hypothetical protein BD410DRAFT_783885 [Rickenella mellea]|uniref:Uncharacterized protein n=1 Tax=Rickenella mellea TaxID=50990 RepID=A0A4Y7QFN3_9AGAM|nr:hypothetical protein BD410DRAFT_783885 [Rickenella mellea]